MPINASEKQQRLVPVVGIFQGLQVFSFKRFNNLLDISSLHEKEHSMKSANRVTLSILLTIARQCLTNFTSMLVCCFSFSLAAQEQIAPIYLSQANTPHTYTSSEQVDTQPKPSLKPTERFELDRKQNIEKSITVKITELRNHNGQAFVGALVSAAELAPYLQQLKQLLVDDFAVYRQNQAGRDAQLFYISLITANEYQHLDRAKLVFGQSLNIKLKGLGTVTQYDNTSYFVVAESSDASFYRQKLALQNSSFAITLGFNPADVSAIKKNINTLIVPSANKNY